MDDKRIKVADSIEDLFREDNKSSKKKSRQTDKPENQYITELSVPECPPAINQIQITQKAFEDLIIMSQTVNEISKARWGPESPKLEVFCYVLTDEKSQNPSEPGIITDIFIPHHTASETSVQVSEESVIEVQKHIRKHHKQVLGWAHSHGHFEVFSSKIDEENHRTLLADTSNYISKPPFRLKYIYGITVNDQSDRYGVILTQYPCGHIQHEVDQQFIMHGKGYSKSQKEQRYQEIWNAIDVRVKLIQPTRQKTKEEMQLDLTEEFIDEYIHNIYRAKNMLFEELPEDSEKNFPLIQKTLQEYDKLLMDSLEESFSKISEKLLKNIQQQQDSI